MIVIEILFAIYIIAFIFEIFLFNAGNTFDVYFGVPGSGKTTFAAWLAKRAQKRAKKVYSNVEIRDCYEVTKDDIGRYDISDGLLIFDEAGIDYNNRDHKNFTTREISFYKKHRHYNVDVVMFSQDLDMDKKLRKLATKYYLIKKSFFPFCISRRTIGKKIDISKESGEIIERHFFVKFSRKLIFAPSVWKMFNTHEREELPKKNFRKY